MSQGQVLLSLIFLQGQVVAFTAFSKNNILAFTHKAKKTHKAKNITFSKILNKGCYRENINIVLTQTSFIIKIS